MSFTFPSEGGNTNAVLASGGTAAVPAIRIRGATNTGIYAATANEVSFSVAGIKKLEVLTGRTIVSNDLACSSYRETVGTVVSSGASRTLAVTGIQRHTLGTGATTFAMPGTASAHSGRGITLFLNTGTSGTATATFTGVKWPGNTAPTVTASAGKVDIFCFVSDGVNWYGSQVQNYTP